MNIVLRYSTDGTVDSAPVAVIGHSRPLETATGAISVATEVRTPDHVVRCPTAPLLAGHLRRFGLSVHLGPHRSAAREWPHLAPARPVVALDVADLPNGLADRLAEWAAAAGPRTVLLASPRSFCAGVERAIEVVELTLAMRTPPVYVRKEIVHNRHVVCRLRERGAVFVDELDEVPDGATVVFSAHGVSPAVRAEAKRRGLEVIDATCPLVTKVHVEARRFDTAGDTVVLVGHAGHEETEGTLGEVPERGLLVQTVEDVAALRVPDPDRVAVLTQTTLAVDEAAEVVEALRRRFPLLREPARDDICYATTNRQQALRAVAEAADVILVIGSRNSSNSLRLVELAQRHGVPAYLVDDASEIDLRWLAGAATVGLTAGASAAPGLVDETIDCLAGFGPITVRERRVATESIRFALPRQLRERR